MLTDALHSALEYGKHVLGRVGTHETASAFAAAAGDGVVDRKLLAEFGVDAALVGMQGALARSGLFDEAADQAFGCAVTVQRAVPRD
jgi:hypothetical protein